MPQCTLNQVKLTRMELKISTHTTTNVPCYKSTATNLYATVICVNRSKIFEKQELIPRGIWTNFSSHRTSHTII